MADYGDAYMANLEVDHLRSELAAKDARIAELEGNRYWEERWRNAERLCDQRGGALEAVSKELAEAKAALEVYDRTFPKKSELELHAALEAANAEFAETKAALDKLQKAYDESHNENRDLLQFIERMEQEIDHA